MLSFQTLSVIQAALSITELGDRYVLILTLIPIFSYALWKKDYELFKLLFIKLALITIVTLAIKFIWDQPRPLLNSMSHTILDKGSFPSGHTSMLAIILFSLTAWHTRAHSWSHATHYY